MAQKVPVARAIQEIRVARKIPAARTTQEARGVQEFLHFLNKPYNFMEKFCFM